MGVALIASAGSQSNEYLARHIAELGWPRPVIVASGGEARRRLDGMDAELVIINGPLPDEFGQELALFAAEKTNAGVLFLAKTESAGALADGLQQHGVLVLGKPFGLPQFRQAVQLAASCRRRLDPLLAENARLLDRIAQLRLVDRAKCALIERRGLTEAEAHRLIEKTAMDSRRSRGEVAQQLLDELDKNY